MNPAMAEEAAALSAQLERWSAAYFRDDEPLVPDADYDAAMRRLQEIEAECPELQSPNPPHNAWVQRRCPPLLQWNIGDRCCPWITHSPLMT